MSPRERKTGGKRGRPFEPGGQGGPGRPPGVPNKVTAEIKKLAQALTTSNPKWVKATKERLERGEEHSSVVVTLLHYAHGRPVERVELANPDGSKLFEEMPTSKMAVLAEASAKVLRRAGHDAA